MLVAGSIAWSCCTRALSTVSGVRSSWLASATNVRCSRYASASGRTARAAMSQVATPREHDGRTADDQDGDEQVDGVQVDVDVLGPVPLELLRGG